MCRKIISYALLLAIFVANPLQSRCNSFSEEDEMLLPRIVNGRPAKQGKYPWAMALLHNCKNLCAFTLITTETALGAAHCIYMHNVNTLEGRIGDVRKSRGIRVYFSKAIIHERFDRVTLKNDIGLLILRTAVKLTKRVNTIPIPRKHKIYKGEAKVAGWGSTSWESPNVDTDELRAVKVNILKEEECEKLIKNPNDSIDLICAGTKGKGICWGDSGTCLVYGKRSHKLCIGIAMAGTDGCAVKGEPSFFESIGYFADWIRRNAVGNIRFIYY